eukprot:4890678-Pyramimonas_sp.AAC.3
MSPHGPAPGNAAQHDAFFRKQVAFFVLVSSLGFGSGRFIRQLIQFIRIGDRETIPRWMPHQEGRV